MLTWKDRLKFRENELMQARSLELVEAGIALPRYALAWGTKGSVHALSTVVTAADAQDYSRLIKFFEAAYSLRCHTVIVTPNCYAERTQAAVAQAERLQAIGDPNRSFRKPTIDVMNCADYKLGAKVWIVDTTHDDDVRQMTVIDVDLTDDVVYSLRDGERVKANVPQSDVFASATGAKRDLNRTTGALADAIRTGAPVNSERDD